LSRIFRYAAPLGVSLLACLASCGREAREGGGDAAVASERAMTNVGDAIAPTQPGAGTQAPRTSGEIQREIVAAEGVPPPGPTAAFVSARRCGWLFNPTPANWWLFDGDGEWILGIQGGYQAPGLEDMPDMTRAGWVEVNRDYGYGCACMTLTVDPATRRVMRIAGAKPKPLKQCRADRRLPRP